MDEKELQKLTLYNLKAKLTALKLPTTGNKNELIARLVEESKKKKQQVIVESSAGYFDHIPDTWIHQVLIYVTATDLGRLAKTCKRFNKITKDEKIWQEQKQKYIQLCKNYLEKRGNVQRFWTDYSVNDPRMKNNGEQWRNVFVRGNFKKLLYFLDKDLAWVHTYYLGYGGNQQNPLQKLLSGSEQINDFLIRAGVETTSADLAALLRKETWEPLHEEWYKLMVQRPSSLERGYEGDKDPLILAAAKRDLKIVKDLVERKMGINEEYWSSSYRDDVSPLYVAALAGKLDVVQYLVENGAKCKDNIFLAVCKKNPKNAAQIIQAIHKAEGSFNVNAADDHNRTALMFACKEGNKELVDWLLTHKANPNLQCGYGANDDFGDRAILLAITSESPDKAAIVTALIKNGADVNARDDYTDATPLSATEDEKLIKLLKANGAKEEAAPWEQIHVES